MSNFFLRFYYKLRDSFAARVNYRLEYNQRAAELTRLALNSSSQGVTSDKSYEREVIVSLTTHGRRLYDVYLAIESIMQGSAKPNRIILWLSEELENEPLPLTLQCQRRRGLEIRYTKDIGPYTKIIPALRMFSESIVITIDDDFIYMYDLLEQLLNSYRKNPQSISANCIKKVEINRTGDPLPILTWKPLTDYSQPNPSVFFEGYGGVLYPPHCFSEEVFRQDVFQSICATADDIWLNCIAKLNNTSIVAANHHYLHFPLLANESVQELALALKNNNPKQCLNDIQFKAVLDYYHLTY